MPSEQMTPAQLRAKAEEHEREARTLRAAADLLEASHARLTSSHGYVTDAEMGSTAIGAKHPGPKADNGPASKLVRELGLSSLSELAEKLGETYDTVRSWNRAARKSIPARVEAAVAKLRKEASAAADKSPKP